MNKLDMESKDIVNENIEKISKLFPNVIVESEKGKSIDFDLLKQELSKDIVEENKEKYQLTWPGKRQAIVTANKSTNKTLRPVKEKSVDFDNTKNIYIEGDNLEALKILQESYLNKVKCIYIDPPYNTGNDFIYSDKYINENELKESGQIDEYNNRLISNTSFNGRFHSVWLSMMYSRLKLARNLLTEDGIIFISIDDNEVTNLKKICDEIFGESNFKSCSVIMNNRGGRDYGGIALQHDYILIYTKTEKGNLNLIEEKDKEFKYYDSNGGFNLMELRNRNIKFNDKNRPNLCYPFYVNPNNKDENGLLEISLEPKKGFIEVFPAKSNGIQTVWRWGKEEKARKNLNIEIFGKENQNGGFMIVQKYRKTSKMQRSIWDEKEFVNERGTESVKELFEGKNYFDYPKSVYTIKRVLELGTIDGCIVLDFFAGSSTTAHAIMNLNANLGTKCKFIMVQLPVKCSERSNTTNNEYKSICDIGEERIRRAAKKVKEETNADIDYGFRVYKVDSSNMKDVYYTPTELQQSQLNMFESNVKDDRTSEDLLTQVILDLGLTLDLSIEKKKILNNNVYFVESNSLVACFDDTIDTKIIDEVCKYKPLKMVFKESSFKTDSDKINTYERIKKLSPETEISVI